VVVAYHVVGQHGVIYETENLDVAKSVRDNIISADTITEGPLEFLRLIALKKHGQKQSQYPSDARDALLKVA
jgi:hypothetical protein